MILVRGRDLYESVDGLDTFQPFFFRGGDEDGVFWFYIPFGFRNIDLFQPYQYGPSHLPSGLKGLEGDLGLVVVLVRASDHQP